MNWLKNLIIGWVQNYLIKNWKTTVVSVVGGICTQIPALAPHKDQILTITLILVGFFAKDGDKTGTAQQPALPYPGTPGVPVGANEPSGG